MQTEEISRSLEGAPREEGSEATTKWVDGRTMEDGAMVPMRGRSRAVLGEGAGGGLGVAADRPSDEAAGPSEERLTGAAHDGSAGRTAQWVDGDSIAVGEEVTGQVGAPMQPEGLSMGGIIEEGEELEEEEEDEEEDGGREEHQSDLTGGDESFFRPGRAAKDDERDGGGQDDIRGAEAAVGSESQ